MYYRIEFFGLTRIKVKVRNVRIEYRQANRKCSKWFKVSYLKHAREISIHSKCRLTTVPERADNITDGHDLSIV